MTVAAQPGVREETHRVQADIVISNLSPEAARRRAFKQAEAHALELAAQELTSVKQLMTRETESGLSSAYRENISTRTNGAVVAVDTLADTLLQIPGPSGIPQAVWHVEIRARVRVTEKSGPSPYDIKVRLKPRLRFEAGDEAWLEIDVRQDSYLHVFNITADDRVLILYPIKPSEVTPISGGTTFRYPRGSAKMRMFPLAGHDMDQEELRVVATRDPIRFLAGDITMLAGEGSYIDLPSTDLLTLEMEIMRVPYDERGQVTIPYEVQKKHK